MLLSTYVELPKLNMPTLNLLHIFRQRLMSVFRPSVLLKLYNMMRFDLRLASHTPIPSTP